MAKLVNPLDQFASHSIHYVVLASRSTENLRPFVDTSSAAQAQTLQAIDACKQLGNKVSVSGNGGDVYLMLDTRRFSQFTISEFDITTIIAGFTAPGSNSPNTVGTEMAFNVIDSTGVSFINFLQFLMDQRLQVSNEGMSLLVRVLFVGHLPNGSTKLVQSVGIPAMFKSIQLDLNDVKGIYTCRCIPMIGMISNGNYNTKWTSIGTASAAFSGLNANTLGDMIRAFEQKLNDETLKRYTQLNPLTPSGATSTTSSRYGRPVLFMITIPKSWETFKFSGPAVNSAHEINFKELLAEEAARRAAAGQSAAAQQKKSQTNTQAQPKDSFIAVNPDLTVTEILDLILGQTTEVAALANFTQPTSKTTEIKFFKHLITVTSDDNSFMVHVDIVEFIVPNVDLATTQSATSVAADDALLFTTETSSTGVTKKIPKNYLEYDYIFSGKNLDVLSMDLKIENLNIMLQSGANLGQGQMFSVADTGQNQANGLSVGNIDRVTQGLRQKDPVTLPQRSDNDRTNYSNNGAAGTTDSSNTSPQAISQQYLQSLSAYYAIVPIKAKLEIRGNPDILERITLSSLPQHVNTITIANNGGVSSIANPEVKSKYRANFEASLLGITPGLVATSGGAFKVNKALNGPSFVSTSVFVKVNVFGPNVNFLTTDFIAGQDFTRKLFYDSFYFVTEVKSRIDGAKFTQDFSLNSYSVFGAPNTAAQGQASSAVKTI